MADISDALAWHLQNNFYPPVPEAMIPYAAHAIELAEAGTPDTTLTFPSGETRTAGELLEELRLWDMVDTGARS